MNLIPLSFFNLLFFTLVSKFDAVNISLDIIDKTNYVIISISESYIKRIFK